MLPLRAAARLLADARSLDGLAALADALGHAGATAPVPCDTLGLADAGFRLAVRRGPGLRRALLVEAHAGEPLRARVARLARLLAARAPHALWSVLATERDGPATVIATWSGAHRPPRVLALTVDRRRIVDSDADAVRALHAARDEPDALAHARWLDVLGRDALGRRFYREVEDVVALLADALAGGPPLDGAARRELALLQLSRLLFLSFLEAKGWLDGDRAFLAHLVERRPTALHRRTLRPLFFGTLNTPLARRAPTARAFGRIPFLNGGLFAPTPLERRARDTTLADDAVAAVIDRLLARYRFTAREDEATWSDAAVDPEMLGRAFESLMHAGARRATGAYYTPQSLVARVVEEGIGAALQVPGLSATDAMRVVAGGAPPHDLAGAIRDRALALRVLDPACGSGAMLVQALDRLADLARRCGDPRTASQVRRALLARSIFGVDVNPTAVWLCELRLWLAAVIDEEADDPLRVPPLPNLDRNVRVGDALLGGELADGAAGRRADPAAVVRLRERYARASGPAKHAAARRLDRCERDAALAMLDRRLASLAARRRDLLAALRGRDLWDRRRSVERVDRARLAELRAETRRMRARRRAVEAGAGLPFAFASHFAELAGSGFDAVVGNPPWVRPHHVAADARAALRRAFPLAAGGWESGARLAGAGAGFAAQADLAALFVERAASLLRPGGALALLVPAKLWRSLAGGGCRRVLAERCALVAIEDRARAPAAFDAAVYPSLVVATRARRPGGAEPSNAVRVAAWHAGAARRWCAPATALALDASPGAPWLLLPPGVRRAFDRLRAAGPPLARTALGRPTLGVKCGVNDAFLVPAADRGARATIEPRLLRPALRGDAVRAWRVPTVPDAIVWTHDDAGEPLDALPPGARRHLWPFRRALEGRADQRGTRPWWSLHRTAAAARDAHRVVWADVARRPRAAVLAAGDPTVPLNTCYALRCDDLRDALAVAAILNAPTIAAWLAALAEPARGGYARHLAWTVACLPIPADWAAARDALAPLAERAWCGAPVDDAELDRAVLRAYGVAPGDVAPLLAWTAG